MAVIQILLDSQPGPLPLTGTFQPQADLPPTLFLTGTAQTSSPVNPIMVGVSIILDGKDAGGTTAVVMSNEAKQHKTLLALPANQKPWSFGQTYTYSIAATGPGTISDANDFYSLTIIY
jgi:hypothetical protein